MPEVNTARVKDMPEVNTTWVKNMPKITQQGLKMLSELLFFLETVQSQLVY